MEEATKKESNTVTPNDDSNGEAKAIIDVISRQRKTKQSMEEQQGKKEIY